MGSSESTARTNGTEEEEQRQQENGSSDRGSMGDGTAIAVATAGAAIAAWGISRMLSNNTENREKDEAMMFKARGTESVLLNLLNSSTNSHGEYDSMHVSYPTRITWSPPPPGRFKMNTDGGCRPKMNTGRIRPDDPIMQGPSGYGGILRDDRGKWVQGFRGFINVSDSLTAEFHGILNGLELLDKLGLRESILESDSTAAINWIKQESYRRRSPIIRDCWEMITECKRLILKNRITINCCSRDANKCADKLANMAIDKQEQFVGIINLPDEIKHIVDHESSVA